MNPSGPSFTEAAGTLRDGLREQRQIYGRLEECTRRQGEILLGGRTDEILELARAKESSLDTIDAVARAQRSRRLHDAINSRRTPCVVCGDHTVNLTCDTCRPVLEHARMIATSEQVIDGKRTRLDAALDYARSTR